MVGLRLKLCRLFAAQNKVIPLFRRLEEQGIFFAILPSSVDRFTVSRSCPHYFGLVVSKTMELPG
jgi:hypothetical protein